MRRIRETLRLHLQAELSYNEVGRTLKISKSVVGKYVSLARAAGVDWEVAQTLSDEALEARLYRPAVPRASHQLAPDFAVVHQPQIGDRRKPSPLGDIQPDHWLAEYTTELLNVLNVLGLLVELEPQAEQLLERICAGPLVTQADLQAAGAWRTRGT